MTAEFLSNQSNAPRILLVEDDLVAALAAQEQLAVAWPDVDVQHVTTIEEALLIARRSWDVALLDLGLPGCSGLQALDMLSQAAPHVPIVVLTALSEEDLAIRALQEEAQDYLSKQHVDAVHLARSVRYAVERHRILSRLRASEQSLRNLVDAHHDGVVVIDEDDDIVYANATAARQLAPRGGRLVGMPAAALPVTEPVSGLHLDVGRGDPPIVDVSVTTLDWEGGPAKMLLVHDVTEHHQAEQLRRHVQHNERMAAIGTLSAGIAHEINNPLTYVLGCLEILNRDLVQAGEEKTQLEETLPARGPARARQLVDRAVEGVERVVAIVRNLGRFSRTNDDMGVEATDLASVIKTALETASPQLRHRARVIVEVGNEEKVEANPGPLTQVFVNLLVNAAHAIEEGRVEQNSVTVRSEVRDEQIVVRLQDSGSGIEENELSRLFDPFYTTKAVGEGTGLGLYVCRSIVEALGGGIRVESKLGEGTTFEVSLRKWTETSRTDDEVPEAEAPSSIGSLQRRLQGARILVVDDEDSIRQAIKMALPSSCDVTLAQSSRTAIEHLKRGEPFDLILCDIVMDDGSGLDLRDWVEHQRPELARKLLFMSGDSLRESSPAPNEHRVLDKPFRQEDLFHRLGDALDSVPPPPRNPRSSAY